MAAGLDLALGPSAMFASVTPKEIGVLVQKPNDKFIIVPAKQYGEKVRTMVGKSKIPTAYKKFLNELINFEVDKDNKKTLTEMVDGYGKDLSETEIEKYFGEVLGPLHLINGAGGSSFDSVVFPTRTNYQLFDFFMERNGKYIGYSSKTGAGVSNTLTPTVISERIKKSGKTKPANREVAFGRDVMLALGDTSIVEGLCLVAGLIVDHKKFPRTMDSKVKAALSDVDWASIAKTIQDKRTVTIDKMGIKGFGKIDYFMSNYIVDRTKMPDSTKRAYKEGKKKYTGNNVAYGLGMFIVDANKDGIFDCSPFLRMLFNDLSVIKLDLLKGVPSWTVKKLEDYTEAKFMFRSKYRWDVIKDKLGIAL
jgi:hypothetical protein